MIYFLATLTTSLILSSVNADVYMHNPRGSNDRNCERNVNRNNGNRINRSRRSSSNRNKSSSSSCVVIIVVVE